MLPDISQDILLHLVVCVVYPGMKEEILNECGLKDRVPNFWSGANDKFDGQES